MKPAEFMKMVQDGLRPVVIFHDAIANKESYWEGSMRGRITGACMDHDHVIKLTVDVGEFDRYNRQFESSNYYDKSGNPKLTAREAGYYKPVDSMYLDSNEDVDRFFQIEDDAALNLFREHQESGSSESYVKWLEAQVINLRNGNEN